jgi:hypothetical protein
MIPSYRRAAHRLTPAEVRDLVARRDAGATWKEIGRTFGKQDAVLKSIYDQAKAAALSS